MTIKFGPIEITVAWVPSRALSNAEKKLAAQPSAIYAIKLYRERTGASLKEACGVVRDSDILLDSKALENETEKKGMTP